jgi:hypothetical protein
LTDAVDTGFDAVIAGEVYEHPEPAPVDPQPTPALSDGAIYAAVSRADAPPEEHAATMAEIDRVVTATVTEPAGLTEEGKQAAKALVHLPALDWPTLARLAREVAMDIKERGALLQEYKLSDAQYDFLEAHNEFYRSALAVACKDWNSPMSTEQRLKLEAAAILEDGLVGLGSRMQNKSEGLPGVIEAAKFFAKVAGVGERDVGSGNSAERFVINIDLGGDQKITVEATPAPQISAGVDSQLSLPALPQTEGIN